MTLQLDLFRTSSYPLPQLPNPEDREFFSTPPQIAEFAATCLWRPTTPRPSVLDIGAGDGIWGLAAKRACPSAIVVGVDLPGVQRIPGYNFWFSSGFEVFAQRAIEKGLRFDVAFSNPPFSRAELFVRLSYSLLKPGAIQVFFLRQGVKAGQDRCKTFWPDLPLRAETVSARRPSFTGNGRTDPRTDYALFVWQKGFQGFGAILPPFDYLDKSTWEWSKTWTY